ncbi:MAG: class I SAM-dependent methyltransferase [Alphaproteobacteria bacterium]
MPSHNDRAGGDPVARAGNRPAGPACPVCRFETCRDFVAYNNIDLFSCADCGTVFMHPLPTAEEVAEIYDDSYDGATTGYFAKVDKKMRRARGRMRYLSRFVGSGRFLDIGCNGGFMVEAARERGFEAHGLDMDGVSIAYARKHCPENRYFHGTVERFAAAAEAPRFDLVYCSEVIEHVPDVHGFVSAIAELLGPDGVLFITTPDISHWRRSRDLLAWDAFCPPSHCIYFNPGSLKLLLERYGLRVIRRRPAFKPGIKLVCRRR